MLLILNLLNKLSFGALLFLSIYHLIIFFVRKERYYLYFFLFSFLIFAYTLLQDEALILLGLPTQYPVVRLGARIITPSLFITFGFFYFLELLGIKRRRKFFLLFSLQVILSLTGLTLLIVKKRDFYFEHIFHKLIISMMSVSILIFALLIIEIIIQKVFKNHVFLITLSGFLIGASGTILTSYFENVYHQSYNFYFIIGISFTVYAYALAKRFNDEHRELIALKESLEVKVAERTEELILLNDQKTNFFINLSHEIKTPLTLIQNYLRKLNEPFKENPEFRIIFNNIKALNRTIKNLFAVSSMDIGKINYDHTCITNVSTILRERVAVFKEYAGKNDLSFEHNIKNDLHCKIATDALDQIINNMIENAIKYTNPGGHITVGLDTIGDSIHFRIKDTGIGISESQQQHLFKPFYQLGQMKNNRQGIGLGLSVVKHILDTANGSIMINSKPNAGSLFVIELPLYHVQEGDRVIDTPSINAPIDNGLTIELLPEEFNENRHSLLIVEDNRQMLAYLQSLFHAEYNVITAESGLDAINKLDSIPPLDLIITDIMMDNIDGYQFIERILMHPTFNLTPFIFLTAKSNLSDKIKSLEMGAYDFISKPFDSDELIHKAANIMSKRSQQIKTDRKLHLENLQRFLETQQKASVAEKMKKINAEKEITAKLIAEYDFTNREKEILHMLVQENDYTAIAEKTDLQPSTARKHSNNIFAKMGLTYQNEFRDLLKKLKADYNL